MAYLHIIIKCAHRVIFMSHSDKFLHLFDCQERGVVVVLGFSHDHLDIVI